MSTPGASGGPARVIEGRVVHKTSNALQITFNDGPGDPMATAIQGAGDGRGAKTAILFGFKNGGTGRHVLTYSDGTTIGVQSREGAPTLLTRSDGSQFGSVQRGDTSTALDASGRPQLVFSPDAVEDRTPDLFRMTVTTPDGARVGEMTVIRKVAGWSVWRAVDAAEDLYIWWDRAGQALKTPLLGTRVMLDRPITDLERDLLLSACVDITIGLRPYIASMN